MKIKTPSWIKQITLRQLRGFESILETGSITAAARNLHLTPPAISTQLRELESAIGIPLVEKKDKSLTPTRAGKELNEMSQKIQALISEYGEVINELSGADHGNVSIGVVSTGRYFIPNLLVEFKALYPDINLQLQIGNREFVVTRLENLELDFAIMGQPPEQFAVQSKIIGKHPQVIIAPTSHPLAGKKKIPFSALKEESFLLRETGSGTRTLTDKLFKKSKMNPDTAYEFGSNETIKQAVMAGMGIALISAHAVSVELYQKRLVALDVQGIPINRTWYIVKHKNKRLLQSSLKLWDYIVKFGKEYLPDL